MSATISGLGRQDRSALATGRLQRGVTEALATGRVGDLSFFPANRRDRREGLLTNWGKKNPAVAKALRTMALERDDCALFCSTQLVDILGSSEARERLAALLAQEDTSLASRALSALAPLLGFEEKQNMVDTWLPKAKSEVGDPVSDLPGSLLSGYSEIEAVREFALELARTERGHLTSILYGFSGDIQIQNAVIPLIYSLPISLRLTISDWLGKPNVRPELAERLLSNWQGEPAPSVACSAAVSHVTQIKRQGRCTDAYLADVAKRLGFRGPFAEAQRQSAFAALLATDKLSFWRDGGHVDEVKNGKLNVLNFWHDEPNSPLARQIVAHWGDLLHEFGEFPWLILMHGEHPIDLVKCIAPYANEYPDAREGLLAYLDSCNPPLAGLEAISFVERVLGRSPILRRMCEQAIFHGGHYGHDQAAAERIFARWFGQDDEALQTLEAKGNGDFYPSAAYVIWVRLGIHNDRLREIYRTFRAEGLPFSSYSEMIVLLAHGSSTPEFIDHLKEVVIGDRWIPDWCMADYGDLWILRVQRDPELAGAIADQLTTAVTPSGKMGLALLLLSSNRNDIVRQWAHDEIRNLQAGSVPEFGLDVTTGRVLRLDSALMKWAGM